MKKVIQILIVGLLTAISAVALAKKPVAGLSEKESLVHLGEVSRVVTLDSVWKDGYNLKMRMSYVNSGSSSDASNNIRVFLTGFNTSEKNDAASTHEIARLFRMNSDEIRGEAGIYFLSGTIIDDGSVCNEGPGEKRVEYTIYAKRLFTDLSDFKGVEEGVRGQIRTPIYVDSRCEVGPY